MSQANTSKLRDIETRTIVVENRIEENTKDRSGAVSYTHLDVYKRQHLGH